MSDQDERLDGYAADAELEDTDEPRANQLVRRSFEGTVTLMNSAATQALTAKATADINARWMIAMHRPRAIMDVRQGLLHECRRPKFAKAAIYAVPRGKTTVKGMSIRFAEAAMKAMGNMGAEAQTLYDSDDERVVRVTVTDFEGNTAWSRDLTVRKTKEVRFLSKGQKPIRSRTNSYGDTVHIVEATDDDVNFKEASAISKASRTGILRLIPAWLLAECQEKCEETMRDAAAKDPDAERRELFDAFAQLNVKPSWIAEWMGHPVELATPAELVDLRQLYRAIRDGQINIDDALKARRDSAPEPVKPAAAGAVGAAKPTVRDGRRASRPPTAAKSDPDDASRAPSGDITPDEAAEIERMERESAKGGSR